MVTHIGVVLLINVDSGLVTEFILLDYKARHVTFTWNSFFDSFQLALQFTGVPLGKIRPTLLPGPTRSGFY
jgi:hypothetical protein